MTASKLFYYDDDYAYVKGVCVLYVWINRPAKQMRQMLLYAYSGMIAPQVVQYSDSTMAPRLLLLPHGGFER